MMSVQQTEKTKPRWLYPVIYALLVVISMLPPSAEKPYAYQDTQDVIINLLMVAVKPYEAFAPVFHVATIAIIILIVALEERMGRVLAAYMGLNYLVIALASSMGTTEKYGFVIHTGALIAEVVMGIAWIVVAFRGELQTSFRRVPWHRWLLLPLALLAFWAPWAAEGTAIRPYFNPLLLLTSPDYGLTYCLTTPVFLFLLVLFYPRVNAFAYRITAFNGLLYGLFNLSHFFSPDRMWMGVLHLPLLFISLYALVLPGLARRKGTIGPAA
ncbi:MAG: hypothetical protein ABIK79_14705 [Chloroflexota bacterium]